MLIEGLQEIIQLQSEFRSAVITAKTNVGLPANFNDAGSLAKSPGQQEVRNAVYACQEMDSLINLLVYAPNDTLKNQILGMIQSKGVPKWKEGFKAHENTSNSDIVNLINKAQHFVNSLEKLRL